MKVMKGKVEIFFTLHLSALILIAIILYHFYIIREEKI